jgi:G:T-mismatch repair DNA endonuclease (very short patch repair protein)
MMKTCIYCNCELEGKKLKVCDKEECQKKHEKNRRERLTKKELVCRECNKVFYRYKVGSGFCSRVCASKYYVKIGRYDKWIHSSENRPLTGEVSSCLICGKEIYRKPFMVKRKDRNIGILCSNECRHKYQTICNSGENHPLFGTKTTPETKEKQRNTLLKKYGVTNAYQLAKHTSLSKPQKELYVFLKENFVDLDIYCDHPVLRGAFKADIYIKIKNIILEFNGTYWHCDPRKYDKNYFNKKKKLYAFEIWDYDDKRRKLLENSGYKVYTIWEIDYEKDKQKILNNLKEVINGEKNQSINDFGSCVGDINWAHVKSGELLEHSDIFSYYNINGNIKCDSLKNGKIEQSAAKPLSGNGEEGSETTGESKLGI